MVAHEIPKLDSQPRQRLGTRYAQRDRAEGLLPAVIYGHGLPPVHVTLDSKSFLQVLHDEAHLIDVSVDGTSDHCLVKSVQWDYLGKHIIHVDLARVDLSEQVEVEVELILKGEPAALKEGGAVLDHQMVMIEVQCRADSIPEHLEHNIDNMVAGEPLTIADLTAPEGVVFTADPDTVIATIQFAREEEEEETDADAAEPEIIEKGKAEEADSK